HHRVLPQGFEDPVGGEQRTQGVSVRVLMRRQKESLSVPDLLRDDIEVAGHELRCFTHSSRSRREIRSPRSVLSSYSKIRVGVRFLRVALAIFPCRNPCDDRRPASELSRSSGEPSTLT